jgi:hypothetical protein
MTRVRKLSFAAVAAVAAVVLLLSWHPWRARVEASVPPSPQRAPDASPNDDLTPTVLYAHNLKLRKGPDFRVYIRWIKGQLARTHAQVNPSLDDPESFYLQIEKGVIHVNIGDIGNYLNSAMPANAPLRNISILPEGDLLHLHGTMHKMLPVELVGRLEPFPDGRVKFHVDKLSVLKIPMKGLFKAFDVKVSDLVSKSQVAGVETNGNDIIFDTRQLLPPPHIRGQLTSLAVKPPDIEVIYGNAPNDEAALAKWHNFLRLTGGTLDFGKLTMRHVDLTMIDASQDPWFDLDLVHYQDQLVNGYTRMTEQAGLEIFMPDLEEQASKKAQPIPIDWLKDRNRSLPPDIPVKH